MSTFCKKYLSTPKEKYDMLCISNYLDVGALKKNRCANYNKMERNLFQDLSM